MSATNTALPDPQTAYNNLFEGVHARLFFAKCAAAGIQPATQEQARYMLETAGKLRAITDTNVVKQAQAKDDPFYQLNASLDPLMERYGLGQKKQATYAEAEVGFQKAAAELMQDQTFYNSVLTLKAAEAESVKAEYEHWRRQQPAGIK